MVAGGVTGARVAGGRAAPPPPAGFVGGGGVPPPGGVAGGVPPPGGVPGGGGVPVPAFTLPFGGGVGLTTDAGSKPNCARTASISSAIPLPIAVDSSIIFAVICPPASVNTCAY